MSEQKKYDQMPLTQVLKGWMTSEGWNDDIQAGGDQCSSRVVTRVAVNDQPHKMYLEVDEENSRFSVYLYSPVNVPPARMPEMVRILNRINMGLVLGRLGCSDDQDANPVQFMVAIDVEGGTLSLTQVTTLVSAAVGTYDIYGSLIAATALTKQSVDALWAGFIEEKKSLETIASSTQEIKPSTH